jgi:4'-phosphopantetheinyl transferase
MTAPGWLTRSAADVPAEDVWLSARERAVLAGLRLPKRRADWRLGRWTAKAAIAAWLDVEVARVEVLAAPDGAPAAWLDGAPVAVSLTLSHRAGRALAAVASAPAVVGCDLELVEPRSEAFVREWLTAGEQRLLAPPGERARDVVANALWTGKEAAAKARREGLRLDVRAAAVRLGATGSGWRPLEVAWPEGDVTMGWWQDGGGWVMAIAGAPAPDRPRPLGEGAQGDAGSGSIRPAGMSARTQSPETAVSAATSPIAPA